MKHTERIISTGSVVKVVNGKWIVVGVSSDDKQPNIISNGSLGG